MRGQAGEAILVVAHLVIQPPATMRGNLTPDEAMWDKIVEHFLSEPRRLRSLGAGVVSLGSWVTLFAVIGRVAVVANSIVPVSTRASEPLTLGALYPGLPTWWIPETPFSVICTLSLVVVGLWLNAVGKRYERALRWG